MKKFNITKEKCSCGKEVQTYDYKRYGRWFHKGYPETHCHCACGVAWGKHIASNTVVMA